MLIKEGQVQINLSKAFYNPRMELNRDISIACIAAFSNPEMTFLDALASTGIRGIRIAKEVGLKCTVNDISPSAYEVIKQNIALNRVEGKAIPSNINANILLSQEYFEIVDIDPFGSPVPFLDAACKSARKLLCITATDTAPLCGSHLKAGIRNYQAFPLKTEYYNEVGVRILIGKIARELAEYDKAAKPLLSYAEQHYYRVYIKIEEGAARANGAMEKLGYFQHCFTCLYRAPFPGFIPQLPASCPNCGGSLKAGGMLWLGELSDKRFLSKVLREIEKRELGKKEQAKKLLSLCREELQVFSYYNHHKLCKLLKIAPLEMEGVIAKLLNCGYKASRTHFSGVGFKTTANVKEIMELLKNR
ncbi:MAG: tRNA (guanine(10)-N(2))-dimethyltransferase [Methanocellales archaeon]